MLFVSPCVSSYGKLTKLLRVNARLQVGLCGVQYSQILQDVLCHRHIEDFGQDKEGYPYHLDFRCVRTRLLAHDFNQLCIEKIMGRGFTKEKT